MAWYKSGSVNVTNGNATVYGNGTLWVDVSILYSGDVWVGPDGRLYEIASIQSNTQLTLASAYLGATANAQAYAVMPIGLLPSALAQQVKATLSTANTALSQAVRFDANQNLTSGQKATARSNIGATAAADVGLGLLSKSVAGGVDVTLTTDEAANLFYEFTGALTANINVIVPGNVRQFFVRNFTSGAYTLTVKTLTGTGIKVLQGTRIHLECDGTNVIEPTSEGQAITADANGNVGIGTSTPAQALDVRNATGGNISAGRTANVAANSEPGTYLVTAPNSNGNSRTWASLRTVVATPTEGSEASALALHTQVAGTLKETMRLDSTGNVGVGTTSPRKKLDVNGAASIGGAGGVGYINFSSATVNDVVAVGCGVTTGFGDSLGLAVQNSTGVLTLATNSTERVRVDAAGNVGVGTSAAFSAGYTGVQINSTGPGAQLRLTNPTTGATSGSGLGVSVDVSAGYVWNFSNMPLVFGTNNAERMRIDSTGNVGIGTGTSIVSKLHVNSATASATYATVGNLNNGLMFGVDPSGVGVIQSYGNQTITFGSFNGGGTATERMRLDTSANLMLNTTTPRAMLTVNTPGGGPGLSVTGKTSTNVSADIEINRTSTSTSVGQGCTLQFNDNTTATNSRLVQGAAGNMQFFGYGSGGWLEHARIDINGNWLVGVASAASHRITKNVTNEAGNSVLSVGSNGATSLVVAGTTTYAPNSAGASVYAGRDANTSRSINASGTINASGADYAEYMTKSDDCGILAKGQIVGVNAQGKLTDKWADAVSFLVKSTDPSYVGGDVWGTVEAIGAQRPTMPVYAAPAYIGPQEPQVPTDYDSEQFPDAPIVPPQPADVGLLEDDAEPEVVERHAAAHAQYLADMEGYVAAKAGLDKYNADRFAYQVDRTARIEAYNQAKAVCDAAHAKHQADVEITKQTFDNVTMPEYEQDLAAFETKLEEARQKVDRIAYCGQVPVNVQGAKPGQFVVPVQDGDGIAGQLVDEDAVTFSQYRRAVGVVQNVLADGRANIRVKVV